MISIVTTRLALVVIPLLASIFIAEWIAGFIVEDPAARLARDRGIDIAGVRAALAR